LRCFTGVLLSIFTFSLLRLLVFNFLFFFHTLTLFQFVLFSGLSFPCFLSMSFCFFRLFRLLICQRVREDAIEVDIDAIRDHTGEVYIGGVMEHVEEAGVHSGDSACAIPPQTLPGWVVEVIDSQESDLGGVKDISVAVKTKGVPEGGHGVWSRMKWEGGVHRVQRVPVTESQGRIHTSAAGVLVLPEAEDVDIQIEPGDLRIDVFRSSGPGGQSVNTTDSAVRITHIPTGTVVSCQNEKSQLQNKESALRILRSRLLVMAQEEADAAASDSRKAQVRTVDRSERIRTYNYPQNRITDHRIKHTSHSLDGVLNGELGEFTDALSAEEKRQRLDDAAEG